MMEHYETKSNYLYLNHDASTTKYINNFNLCVQKLEKLEVSWTEYKKILEFKDMFTDEYYDTELHVHSILFNYLVQYLQIRESDF